MNICKAILLNILVPVTCITAGHNVIMTERFAEMKGNHEQHYYIYFVCVFIFAVCISCMSLEFCVLPPKSFSHQLLFSL